MNIHLYLPSIFNAWASMEHNSTDGEVDYLIHYRCEEHVK